MIHINKDYEFERDSHCWQLHEWRDGTNPKTGKITRAKRTTYHASLEQVAHAVLDRSAGKANSMEELLDILRQTKQEIREAIDNARATEGMESLVGEDARRRILDALEKGEEDDAIPA